jgi:S-adenosylmethionine:tRNA ribosyltransferase-isomerase
MDTARFSFELPEELIAQHPPEVRGTSRLMVVDRKSGAITHHVFPDLISFIPDNALLVFNNARVRKARIFASRERDGGACEFLLLEETSPGTWKALAKPMKKIKTDDTLIFPEVRRARVARRDGDALVISFESAIDEAYLDKHGAIPLPPYIRRPATSDDETRYQTVYATNPGSVAAPTAGLHFTEGLREDLRARGIEQAEITLDVGIGTFLPIRTDKIEEHVMHEETYAITPESAERITTALEAQRPVLAVGTTSVRALESSVNNGRVEPGTHRTSLYIYPGYCFKAVSMLLTNFHTPRSSLLVMVSAFAGLDLIRRAYAEAVRERYRFFSYGDAMLIL